MLLRMLIFLLVIKLKGNIFYFSSVVDTGDIAELSEYEANLYLFFTGTKSPATVMGVAWHEPVMGSVCNHLRRNRQTIVRYGEVENPPNDPGSGAACQNSEVCTGQVNIFLFINISNHF